MNWGIPLILLVVALALGIWGAMTLPTPFLAGIGAAVVVAAPVVIVAFLLVVLLGRLLVP